MTSTGRSVEVEWSEVSVVLGGRTVLDGFDLTVPGGSWLAVIGPNGAGKTSLMRTLAGTLAHTGTVRIGDDDAGRMPGRERARRLAVVPQHPVIPPGIGVFDYALLGRSPHQGLRFSASDLDRRRTSEVLVRLELDGFAYRSVDTLSGGERQRVVVARALVQDTPILVLDEPTSFLDLGHQLEVLELIAELRAERLLTVISTLHDLAVAGQFADVVAVLDDGHLITHGTPAEVLTPEIIANHWGVHAHSVVDEDGSVTVTVHRRQPT
jgi:iron complex transport system ATP-binding protein